MEKVTNSIISRPESYSATAPWSELSFHLKRQGDRFASHRAGHGVKYLGAVIKPYRMYAGERTVKNYRKAIACQNNKITGNQDPCAEDVDKLLCSLNSYLGYMKHYKSYGVRCDATSRLCEGWWLHVATTGECRKFVRRSYYAGIPWPVEMYYERQ